MRFFRSVLPLLAAASLLPLPFLLLRPLSGNGRRPAYSKAQWPVMGTIASYESSSTGEKFEIERATAMETFAEAERTLSVFREGSAIFIFNKTGEVSVPLDCGKTECSVLVPLLFSLEFARSSGGSFSPAVNPLMRLWGFRSKNGKPRIPAQSEIEKALRLSDYRNVSVATNRNGTVTFKSLAEGTELDLGGVAKGYAVDLAFARLKEAGAENFLINLGGNIKVGGKAPGGRKKWRIAVRDPMNRDRLTGETILLESGEAVSTSGSYERFVVIGGEKHSHIMDPKTGRPCKGTGSASVVSRSAMEADARSTSEFVLRARKTW